MDDFWDWLIWNHDFTANLWGHTIGVPYRIYRHWRFRRDIIKKFGKRPAVGDVVCNCKYEHLPITKILNSDDVELEGGGVYSLWNCCDPVPHKWRHEHSVEEK